MSRSGLANFLKHYGVWAMAALVACVLALYPPELLQRLDLLAYDTSEPLFRTQTSASEAVIIAVDEPSLSALGRWPWDRAIHAQLIDQLSTANVAAIGLTLLLAEPSASDDRLAASITASGRVVLPVAPQSIAPPGNGVSELRPTPRLGAAAAALGHVDVELDADALARRTYRYAGSGEARWEALPLALASLQQAGRQTDAAPTKTRATGAAPAPGATAATNLLWEREGEILLPYPSAGTTPLHLSYSSLLKHPELTGQLRDKVVFIGATATGINAALPTPNSRHSQPMAAVEFHARAYDALRNGLIYHTASSGAALALSLIVLALAAVLHSRVQATRGALIAVSGLSLVPPLVSGLALNLLQWWIPPATAVSSLLLGSLLWFGLYLKRTRGSLQHAEHDADATLRSIADAVFTLDEKTRISLANPVAERLTGLARHKLQGNLILTLMQSFTDQTAEINDAVLACIKGRQTIRLPELIEWHSSDGRKYALRLTATPVGDSGEGAVLVFHDLTETLAVTARLQHEATHDLLTGLPNRALLLDRLHQALANAERQGSMLALLFIDLDRFKRINDSLGHHAGDHVLQEVTSRLQASVRSGDTIARWGGDEFIILMDRLHDRSAVVTVARKLLDLLDREFEADGNANLLLSCSIGISVGPTDSFDAATLLSMADTAMYRGKLEGGNRYTFYSSDMNTWSRERLAMETALRHGLANHEFELFYQPQINIATGNLVGLESLIRWHRPGGGLVQPDIFIAAAEESGIICNIGDWAIVEAMTQIARWEREGLPSVPLAVNISARQCSDMAIVDTIRRALANSGVEPSMLKVELTESTAMRDAESAASLLQSIHQMGVSVAVDDFGTGYSSLSVLRRCPISELKIDRSFVSEVGKNSDDEAIVQSTIALAHGLGMNVVAEGVETQAQLRFLAEHGCDVAQGFLFAKPLPADEVRNWLSGPPPHVLRTVDNHTGRRLSA